MSAFLLFAGAMLAVSLVWLLPPLLVKGDARRTHAGVLGLGVPLLACLLYAMLGTPVGLLPPPAPSAPAPLASSGGIGQAQIEAMVQRLADRLKQQPGDADGWRKLARSYETLRRFDGAADAYRHLLALEPDNLDARVDYAVVLGMTLGSSLVGEPERQLREVLARDPNHLQALALAGSAAMERGDKAAAVAHWKKIVALAPGDAGLRQSMEENIANASR
ncbi:MAG: tetratricopeptide repeat protein [Gammaproteobacteria bacterium]